MPEIGEIRKAIEVGRHNAHKYVWSACVDCGKRRWVALEQGKPTSQRCYFCAAKIRPNWREGKHRTKEGYVLIKLYPDDFFYSMVNKNGYIPEHRLVMAKHLGRCLQVWEKVHHKDGIKDHNEYNNLRLATSQGEHMKEHCRGYRDGYRKGFQDGQSETIKELKTEIRLLRWQIKQREEVI